MSDGQAADNIRRQAVTNARKRKQAIPTFQQPVPLMTRSDTNPRLDLSGRLILSRNTFFYEPASVQFGHMARC